MIRDDSEDESPKFVNDWEQDLRGGRVREAENGDLYYKTLTGPLILLKEDQIVKIDGEVEYAMVLGSLSEVPKRTKCPKTDGGEGGSGH